MDQDDLIDSLQSLKEFDFIGSDTDIDGVLNKMLIASGLLGDIVSRFDNRQTNKYGLDENSIDIVNALMPLIKYDIELYDSLF